MEVGSLSEKILLFIPAYNCEKQITRVLDQVDESIMNYISEVIVVNNLSTDSTEEKVIQYIKEYPRLPIKLLRNYENYGLGGSHKTAFNYAIKNDFDYIIVLHGDDQGDIHDLLPILQTENYKNYDCCLGARFMRGSKLKGYSKFRTFGNIVYNMLFSIVVKQKICDLGSGLNLYRVKILKDRFWYKYPDKLTFNYCMIMAANQFKHKTTFFPILWREDDQVSNVKMTSQAINVLVMLCKYFLAKEKFLKSDLRENIIDEYGADIIYEGGNQHEEKEMVL